MNNSESEFVLSVVSPFYNESEVIVDFCKQLRQVLIEMKIKYEVILVNDASTDNSCKKIMSLEWEECKIINLQKNVGHQNALSIGLELSKGKFVVTLDSDLQHPPVLIPKLLEIILLKKVDVVQCVRLLRKEDTLVKRLTALIYYKLIKFLTNIPIVENAADFRIMSRSAVDMLNNLPESKIFRLLLPFIGFRTAFIEFEAEKRFAGKSKYTLRKMFALALSSSISFSIRPLYWIIVVGFTLSILSLFWVIAILVSFTLGKNVAGWTSLASLSLMFGGFQLFTIGTIGIYVGKILEILKKRPISNYEISQYSSLGAINVREE